MKPKASLILCLPAAILGLPEKHLDIVARGRTDDSDDYSAEFTLRSGFLCLPNKNIDPNMGQPTDRVTREQFQNMRWKSAYRHWFNADDQSLLGAGLDGLKEDPDSYPFALTPQEYYGERFQDTPDQLRPRLFFYNADTHDGVLDEFRQVNGIPAPNHEKLKDQISQIGYETVTHLDSSSRQRTHQVGEGDFLRLIDGESVYAQLFHDAYSRELAIHIKYMDLKPVMYWQKEYKKGSEYWAEQLYELKGSSDSPGLEDRIRECKERYVIELANLEAINMAHSLISKADQASGKQPETIV